MRNALIERKTALNKVNMPVSYLTEEDIWQLSQACRRERDRLLIMFLYQTGLRISEALALVPASIRNFDGRPVLEIIGKGEKVFPHLLRHSDAIIRLCKTGNPKTLAVSLRA